MMRATEARASVWLMSRMAAIVSVVLVLLFSNIASAAVKTWTGGAGDGKWETGVNWNPPGEPGADDDVVIPPNKGEIKVKGKKEVKSLDVKDSNPNGTTIRPRPPEIRLKITAKKDVKIGKGCTVRGNDGAAGGRGGNAEVRSGGGNVTVNGKVQGGKGGDDAAGGKKAKKGGKVLVNADAGKVTVGRNGELKGGDGGSGKKPKEGGKVTVEGKDIDNRGKETGGKGGDYTGAGAKPGAKGGDVENKAGRQCRPGKKKGGKGGAGTDAANPAKNGRVTSEGDEFLALAPGDVQAGDVVSLITGKNGKIVLSGLRPDTIIADSRVIIDAGSGENVIDLTGNTPGIDIITAGRDICVYGAVKLNTEVSLAAITSPDAEESPVSCVPREPPLRTALVLLSILLLILMTFVMFIRGRSKA